MLFMCIAFILVMLLGLNLYIFSNVYLKKIFEMKCLLSTSKTYIERLSNSNDISSLLHTNLLNRISSFLYKNHPIIPIVFHRYITHYILFFENATLDKDIIENVEMYYEMEQVLDEILNWMMHYSNNKIAYYEEKLSMLKKAQDYITFVVTAILSLFGHKLIS